MILPGARHRVRIRIRIRIRVRVRVRFRFHDDSLPLPWPIPIPIPFPRHRQWQGLRPELLHKQHDRYDLAMESEFICAHLSYLRFPRAMVL